VGFFFVIKSNYRRSIVFAEHKNNYLIKLNRNVTYLNRAVLSEYLQRVPDNSELLIDVTRTEFIDPDIRETLEEFVRFAPMRNIVISFNGDLLNPSKK
jgi:anti-anti-sigma regulatory factor